MPQAAAIAIQNGAATPATVTFSPESVTPQLATFADRSTGVANAFQRLTLATAFVGGNKIVNRTILSFALPVTTIVENATVVKRVMRAKLELTLPDGATDAERKDLYAFVKNALSNPSVTATLRDLDPQY